MKRRPQPAMLVASVALMIALGGTAFGDSAMSAAKKLISGKQIKDNSVAGRDVKNRSLTAADFKPGTLLKGDTGATGATGPPGKDGATGPQGPQGVPGPVDTSSLVKGSGSLTLRPFRLEPVGLFARVDFVGGPGAPLWYFLECLNDGRWQYQVREFSDEQLTGFVTDGATTVKATVPAPGRSALYFPANNQYTTGSKHVTLWATRGNGQKLWSDIYVDVTGNVCSGQVTWAYTDA